MLAVVAAGLYLGNRSLHASPATRMQDRSVWASIDVLLEALVFALMGLQLIRVLKVQDPSEASRDEAEELAAREVAKRAAHERLREIGHERLASLDLPPEKVERLKERLERLVDTRYRFAEAAITLNGEERSGSPQAQFAKARRELLITQRKAMLAENRAGRLDDEILRKVLRELDLEELSVSATLTNRLG